MKEKSHRPRRFRKGCKMCKWYKVNGNSGDRRPAHDLRLIAHLNKHALAEESRSLPPSVSLLAASDE